MVMDTSIFSFQNQNLNMKHFQRLYDSFTGARTIFIQRTSHPNTVSRQAFDAVLWDNDNDGYDEVYVINDMGSTHGPNTLWDNVNGTLVPNSNECRCELTMDGMGVDIGDVNNDGMTDLLTDSLRNRLLLGDTDGSWIDVTQSTKANLEEWEMSWGGIFVDYNNDGLLDILTAQGDLYYEEMNNPPYIGDMQLQSFRTKNQYRFYALLLCRYLQ